MVTVLWGEERRSSFAGSCWVQRCFGELQTESNRINIILKAGKSTLLTGKGKGAPSVATWFLYRLRLRNSQIAGTSASVPGSFQLRCNSHALP